MTKARLFRLPSGWFRSIIERMKPGHWDYGSTTVMQNATVF